MPSSRDTANWPEGRSPKGENIPSGIKSKGCLSCGRCCTREVQDLLLRFHMFLEIITTEQLFCLCLPSWLHDLDNNSKTLVHLSFSPYGTRNSLPVLRSLVKSSLYLELIQCVFLDVAAAAHVSVYWYNIQQTVLSSVCFMLLTCLFRNDRVKAS